MATTFGARTRAAFVVASTVVLTGALAGPASAMASSSPDPKYDDGQQTGTPLSATQVFLIFIGIPALVAGLVWLLVKAPGWTRSGRADEAAAWTGESLSVTSSDRPGLVQSGQAPADPAALESFEPSPDDQNISGTGGTSATY